MKRGIIAIEEILTSLGKKYGEPFVYASYSPAIEYDEELRAYPQNGSKSDIVTVNRTYDASSGYSYSDNYGPIRGRRYFEEKQAEFFDSLENGRVNSNISFSDYIIRVGLSECEDGATQETILQSATGNVTVYLKEEDITPEMLQEITQSYGAWMNAQGCEPGTSLTIHTLSSENFSQLTQTQDTSAASAESSNTIIYTVG